MAKKIKLPPVPEVRPVELNQDERNLLTGLLTEYQMQVAERYAFLLRNSPAEDHASLQKKRKEDLAFIHALDEKIMPEEEAAAILQDMGFEIVEKEKAP